MAPSILVGTRKGLFLLKGDETRRKWETEGPYLAGWDVFHAMKDEGSIFAAANHAVYGATVQRSDDAGKTWERSEGLGLPEDHELTLEKTWHVEAGPNGMLWLGGAPGVLFRSADRGQSWEPVTSLIDHPTRERWNPGAGGMCTHSIQFDPENDQTMYVGISAAGVFRSEDAGASWRPANKGTAADFMPDDPFPEVGQCVHKVLVHPAKTDRLWQQNHCGVYRTDDRGENWERLEENGLPSAFGFPIVSSCVLNSLTAVEGSWVMVRRYSRVRSERRPTMSPDSPASSNLASSALTARVYLSADATHSAQNVIPAVTAASCVRAASTRTPRS